MLQQMTPSPLVTTIWNCIFLLTDMYFMDVWFRYSAPFLFLDVPLGWLFLCSEIYLYKSYNKFTLEIVNYT